MTENNLFYRFLGTVINTFEIYHEIIKKLYCFSIKTKVSNF